MIRKLVDRMKALVRGRRLEDELDDELRFHLEMLIETNLRDGMAPAEARHAALRTMGGIDQHKEAARDTRWTFLDSLGQDLRYATRTLGRTPLFTVAAILTLALGIGANTAIFRIVDATLFHPLAVTDPDRLVTFVTRSSDGSESKGFLYPDYVRFATLARSFTLIAAEGSTQTGIDSGTETEPAALRFVTGDYFRTLGVQPQLGRWFHEGDDRPGAAPVVVLTDRMWRAAFGADPDIVGKTIRATGVPVTVVGVAPPGIWGLDLVNPAKVFAPLQAAPTLASMRFNFFSDVVVETEDGKFSPSAWLSLVGRLKPGVTREQAEAEVRALTSASDVGLARHPETISLVPAASALIPGNTRATTASFAVFLLVVVGLVLIVGSANLAALLLARAEQRKRELAVRLALGAGRLRLMRQVLTESLLLALLGAVAGLVISPWVVSALSAFRLPGEVAIQHAAELEGWRVLAFAASAGLVAALVCGLAPAWRAARLDLVATLHSLHGATGRGSSRFRPVLLAVQVAFTIVLVVAAGLFVRSVRAGLSTELGFDREHLFAVTVAPGLSRYEQERASREIASIAERLGQQPGVRAVGFGPAPFDFPNGGSGIMLRVDGEVKARKVQRYQVNLIDHGYLRTIGMDVVTGRPLTADDVLAARRVTIVNESMASLLWAGQNPLGRRVGFMPFGELEVIGVVRNALTVSLTQASPTFYLPQSLAPSVAGRMATLVVRTTPEARSVLPMLRAHVRSVDRNMPIGRVDPVDDLLGGRLMTQRLGASLLGSFSVLALVIALTGTYGLVAYAVARRTSEIGLRVALGARPGRVLALVFRTAVVPILVGAAAGLAGAFAASRLAKSFLFGVGPSDPVSYAAAALVVIGSGVMAAYLPARRASRIDPMIALRAE